MNNICGPHKKTSSEGLGIILGRLAEGFNAEVLKTSGQCELVHPFESDIFLHIWILISCGRQTVSTPFRTPPNDKVLIPVWDLLWPSVMRAFFLVSIYGS